jgi:hypothetical protein
MSQRKSTTPSKRTASTQLSRREMRRALAVDLALILSNPETPSELYNFIADSHSDWETDKPWYTADELERALENHERKEAKRRKGGRANG